jgi:aspartyl-tRNA(Asn)/glutamyl-tRNA(Gln) amidotransferase subunit A
MDIKKLTLAEARKKLDAKEMSAVELTAEVKKAAEAKNPELHAYLELFDSATEDAKNADAIIAKGEAQALTGIPLAIKDNILIEGHVASAASKILEHYTASYDATVTKKLKGQSAVLLGRTNMDEFALGGSTENSAFGPTKNPHDMTRVPGGTSGGSAAAVAAGIALGALGTDTGGSIRQPSAFSGVVGLKPTYGRVSRFGVIAAASSLDQVGCISKNVADTKLMYGAIMGHDANDSTSLPDTFFKTAILKPKKIGVPRTFLQKGIDADVLSTFEHSLEKLKSLGYELVEIELPTFPKALATYYIINPAEVSSNLSRYDGIRYGHSVDADNIREVYNQSRGTGFGKEARRRIIIGSFVLSSGYADAYYRKALAVREMLRDDIVKAFASVDVIATPTTPTPAFKIGEKEDPLAMYAGDIFTVPVNLTGVPAISIPMGTVVRDGVNLPVGFQFIAPHGAEEALFMIGSDFEKN